MTSRTAHGYELEKGARVQIMRTRRLRSAWAWFLSICLACAGARGQLQLVPALSAPRLFAGPDRSISLLWRNGGDKIEDSELRFRLYQASSATAMPIMERPWKRLSVLSGQTVLESASFDFPAVKAETRFVIQWLDVTNRVLGSSQVDVFPNGLLQELSTLATHAPLGSYDPQQILKPLLKQAGVSFVELQEIGFAAFQGRLAIAGPFGSKTEIHNDTAARIKALADRGIAVVWLVPPPALDEGIQPSFSIITTQKAAIVLVQPSLVANLAEDPQAQLNLIEMARLALHPEAYRLPQFAQSPAF